MKWTISLAVLMVVVTLGVQADSVQPKGCTPNTTWKKGCNTCRCVGNGHSICTQMACIGGNDPPADSDPADGRCTAGTTWKQGCNSCSCIGGRAACTMKMCLRKRRRQTPSAPSANLMEGQTGDVGEQQPSRDNVCTPGQVWKKECNTCRCTPGGLPACTKMRCIKIKEQVETQD